MKICVLRSFGVAPFIAAFLLCLQPASAQTSDGWTDPRDLIVVSDGSRSLGNPALAFNSTRDQGSKIVYFDTATGDNVTADVYWWNGTELVDSAGNTANPDNDEIYGTDPLNPNEAAIRPFAACLSGNDNRLRTQAGSGGPNRWRFSGLAGGYPDFFLFRRGQVHSEFDRYLVGGRSEAEPMVVAAYGPLDDGRAIFDPGASDGGLSPFHGHNWGDERSWLHHALFSLEIRGQYGLLTNTVETYAEGGGPVTAFLEDCYWPGRVGNQIAYPPMKSTFRRCVVTYSWRADSHNQGFFNAAYKGRVTLDEVIFYQNGFKEDPRTEIDPRRDIFSRNIYQGGGARMGHVYRNIISMDGGSGGPQMRLGGLIENSLLVEGYWYHSTESNGAVNEWAFDEGQFGRSAVARNNVQLVYRCDTPADPDPLSDARSQPGSGYALQGFSFGGIVEDNIISGAMVEDDLLSEGGVGMTLRFGPYTFSNGQTLTLQDNVFRDNIVYRMRAGLGVEGDSTNAKNLRVEDNVFVSEIPFDRRDGPQPDGEQLALRRNRFYTDDPFPEVDWLDESNSLAAQAAAVSTESWPDPDRTLKRYVTEVLGLTLLEWADDPFIDQAEAQLRIDAGEAYDPAGMRTFMAVATNMRHGGRDAIPTSGKPDMTGDYPWDDRFTAVAVVNWIREGFGKAPVSLVSDPSWDVENGYVRLDWQGPGHAPLEFYGENLDPRVQYHLQRSTDLDEWDNWRPLEPDAGGALRYTMEVLPSEDSESEFYRVAPLQ